jgi:indolepyruvate ferredoxin oxidoreductase alpha subunit
MKKLVLGNEALAQGAIDAGLSGVYAYPGTPSTEITEYIQRNKYAKEAGIHSSWSVNEKTAMEAALGMSYTGKRAMVVMKHVGLNVAADAFMNISISGINGGLVVVVADDPSMHSSQNEQDSRYYGKFAMIPILEPSNQQEAYDITRHAFDLSEELKLPILVRMVTRLSHSRAGIVMQAKREQNAVNLLSDTTRFTLIPAHARVEYQHLLEKQPLLLSKSIHSDYNHLYDAADTSIGIIACGISYNYLMENFEDTCPYPVLKVSQYPVPKEQLTYLYNKCDQLLILEEGYPIIEERLKDYFEVKNKIIGRLSGDLPRSGELNPNLVGIALNIQQLNIAEKPQIVSNRPPQLCDGCGHTDLFNVLNELTPITGEKRVFGDIGCYALGALPPLSTIDALIDMGASITMAKGASDSGLKNVVAVIGDSTFTHSGMTGLLDCVFEKTPITIIISDNSAIAMTGAQDTSALGRLEQICIGIGVDKKHLKLMTPLRKNHDKNVALIRDEINYEGVSVIISRRACVRLSRDKKEAIKLKIAEISDSY